jgi:RNA polymerase sigma-70 factor (ECF subfamily)
VEDVDRQARLEAWFRAHADRVLAYLLHRTDRDTAQDVLQEVFVTAFRKAEQLPEPPIGWLLGTARRLLANSNRGARRRAELTSRVAGHRHIETESGRVESGGDDPAALAVGEALGQLSIADREVLTLSAWYGLTGEEAAQALGCSPSAYGVRLHRARHRLADRLRAAGYPRERVPEVAHD